MGRDHLRVPIDALFFTRLSGMLSSAAGRAAERGDKTAQRVLQGISEAVLETLVQLGNELKAQ